MLYQIYKKICLLAGIFIIFFGCSIPTNNSINDSNDQTNGYILTPISENAEIIIPEKKVQKKDDFSTIDFFSTFTHTSVSKIAASQCGLSAARCLNIENASDDPDTYQAGLDNGYNQQWSHAYIYDDLFGYIYYLWGDADEDFHDNIDGPIGGEGYNGYYAGYYYSKGDQITGDKYLGYALHYIEDVSLVLHSTAPTSVGITVPYKTVDMLTNHFAFEEWINNNLNSGWYLLDAVKNDYYYYEITDLKQAIKNAAWASCAYKGTTSIGYSAWTAYRSCGYPTGSGTGNAALADNAKKMLIAAGRYAKGAIKYTLDKNSQWSSKY